MKFRLISAQSFFQKNDATVPIFESYGAKFSPVKPPHVKILGGKEDQLYIDTYQAVIEVNTIEDVKKIAEKFGKVNIKLNFDPEKKLPELWIGNDYF